MQFPMATVKKNALYTTVVLLRNVQVPRRNSDSHLFFRDPSHLRAKKRIYRNVSVLEPGIL
jgi:hypothetical protein